MGILSGALTVRRYRVVGAEIPDNWRTEYRDRLEDYAFKDRPAASADRGDQTSGKEELEGWVQVHNLLDTSFADPTRWLYTNFAVFALRVDKKSLPAKLFNATVQKKCEEWCQTQGVERCPNSIKKSIKEELEFDWLKRALPRVAITECVWNVTDGFLLLGSLSESTSDRFRKRFLRTFGLKLIPWSPAEWVGEHDAREALLASTPAPMTEAS